MKRIISCCLLLSLLITAAYADTILTVPSIELEEVTYDGTWQELLESLEVDIDFETLMPGGWWMRKVLVGNITKSAQKTKVRWHFDRPYNEIALIAVNQTADYYNCFYGVVGARTHIIFFDFHKLPKGKTYFFLFQKIPNIDFPLKF